MRLIIVSVFLLLITAPVAGQNITGNSGNVFLPPSNTRMAKWKTCTKQF